MTVQPSQLRPLKHAAWLHAVALSATLLGSMAIQPVKADRISDETGDIAIIDAAVDPAKRGAYTNIHLRIENSGPKTVTLKSVETKLGERGSFDVHAGRGSVHSGSFSLGSGEQVSFDDGRFRLTLGPLKRDLNEGGVVEVTFTFDSFAMIVPVHIHRHLARQSIREGG